jgi:sialic acid synthase SpsE
MIYEKELVIDDQKIGGEYPTYFIADIAANHDGNLQRAIDLINMAKEAGANAAKFQHFKASSIVSDLGFRGLGDQSSHQANWKKSVFEVYKEAEVELDWTLALKDACDDAGITFFTSPYAFDLVDYVDPYVPAYKIGSGDITWIEMIQYIASKGKPVILATGASCIDDVHRAVIAATEITPHFALMQCNTNYTGSLENFRFINLNVLRSYQAMYPGMVLGLSDHTPGLSTVLGAVALGARIVEKHFTDDVMRNGPDHAFSMSPQSWREMVDRTRELENALGNGVKVIEQNELQTAILQRRAIRLARDMAAGEVLRKEDLEMLRPCPIDGIQPYRVGETVGKKIRRGMVRGQHLRTNDIE